ncbi:MAG: hypothetical protein ACI837_003279 [Crocinitomicaceae bacterium]|jgi:hypothetical protein
MKSIFLVALVISCVLFSCESDISSSDSADNAPSNEANPDLAGQKANEAVPMADRILSVASGKLTFEYSGAWTGTETVWFDRYGKRAVVDQDIHYSPKDHQKKRLIWSGALEGSYTCHYLNVNGEEEKSWSAPPLRVKDTELSIFSHGDKMQLHQEYNPIGQKTILGKVAIGWKSKSGQTEGWIWRGVDMSYSKQGVIKEIQMIEKIDEIPSELLALPEGFKMD